MLCGDGFLLFHELDALLPLHRRLVNRKEEVALELRHQIDHPNLDVCHVEEADRDEPVLRCPHRLSVGRQRRLGLADGFSGPTFCRDFLNGLLDQALES